MHIQMKKQLLEMIESMKELQKELFHTQDITTCIEVLGDCQQAAIAIGNQIELELPKDIIIVPLLENYCELLYQVSKCEVRDERVKLCEELEDTLQKVQSNIEDVVAKYRVVFLPYKADMWDSLESIWIAFSKDERFECDVVAIPYYEAVYNSSSWELHYDGNRFPKEVPITHYENYVMEEMKPDLGFVHNPFDDCNLITSVHPNFYSRELKRNVGTLVYVPYYANSGFISETYQKLEMFENADYIIAQSESAKESCRGRIHYDKVLVLGSPKFDKVIAKQHNYVTPNEWQEILQGKKVLLLNTTLTDFEANFMTILPKIKYVFQLVEKFENIALIWRPHPLLECSIKAMRAVMLDQYHELLDYFRNSKIGVLDFTSDISNSIGISCGYIGSSYSSVVNLFEVCGKPAYLIDSKEIYYKDETKAIDALQAFKRNNPLEYFACYESERYAIEDYFHDIEQENLYEVKKLQLKTVKDRAANLDGTSGQKIHDYMVETVLGACLSK